MAEERFIDDDKDKKYRFRINADGEEELIIDEGGEDEKPAQRGEEAQLSFDHAPDIDEEYAYGGEDPHYETHEEKEAVAALLEKARADAGEGNFSTALEYIAEAKDIAPDDGEVAALELAVYTSGLTDFSPVALEGAVPAAKRVAQFSSAEDKLALKEAGADALNSMICALQPQVKELKERNEQGKAERAVGFEADNKKSIIRLVALLIPFVVTLALTIYFSTVMYADTSGTNIILTIVFAALAFVFFIICVFAARALNITARRVRMNRDNSRTQVGRDYEAANSRLEALRTIYNAITE